MNPQPHRRHRHHPRLFSARLLQQAVATAALLAALPSLALTCDELQSEVEAKIRSAGVTQFTISVADADAAVPGKVVGSCEMGSKKLLYTVAAPADRTGLAAANPTVKTDVIITECKDGSVSTGGNCGK